MLIYMGKKRKSRGVGEDEDEIFQVVGLTEQMLFESGRVSHEES